MAMKKNVIVGNNNRGTEGIFVLLQVLVFLCLVFISLPLLAVNINFGPNGCTLQDAIRSANNDSAVGNCSAGSGHDILISPDVWVITLSGRLPTITSDITIKTTTNSGLLKISGDNDHAVMKITGNDTDVTLQRVWITQGYADLIRGAGIHIEDAAVTLNNTIVSFNRSTARYGGGIYIEDGVLDINDSYLEYNQILNAESNPSYGGALYAHDSTVTINTARFVANESKYRLENIDGDIQYWDHGFGASVFMDGGHLTVNDSLFSENESAVYGQGTVATLANSTFNRSQVINWHDQRGHVFFTDTSALTLNHVTLKAALRIEDSILNMTNSILQGDCNIAGSTAWVIDAGNIYNTPGFSCDGTGSLYYYPKLLSLSDNGGLTETFALEPSSDAINSGDPTYCLPTDQRGVARDAACDVGAYEAADFIDIEVSGALAMNSPYVHGQALIYELTIKNNSFSVVNEIKINLDTEHATITGTGNSLCGSFPCTLNNIQGQQSITIPVHVTFSSFENDFEFNVTAEPTIHSTFTDTDLTNNQHNLTGDIEDGADLSVQMDLVSPGNHFIGEFLEYAVVIDNFGFNTATDVSLELSTTGLNFVSFSGCGSVNGQICQLGTMINGSSKDITVLAEVVESEFDAIAEISSSLIDIYPENNIDLQGNNGALGETDISVGILPDFNPPYYSDGYMQFTVKISTGNQSASNIRVWQNYPGGAFISCSHLWNFDGYCEVPFIAAQSSEFLTFSYFNPVINSSTQQQVTFSVLATPGETDLNLQNNEDSINLNINAVSDMVAQLSLNAVPPFYTGQELEFHLRVVNGGLNTATAVNVDVVPDNLTLVWLSGNLCQSENCNLAQMERFNEENMVLVYRIEGEGEFSLGAQVSANQDDLSPTNNIDVVTGTAELPGNDLIFADDFE